MSGGRTSANERLRRVLAIVPWIVANPGVEVETVAERFGLTTEALISDLNVVWMIGLPPYTPDALVEVVIEDGRVWIHYADFFARPLRLSPAQALALLASTDGLLSVPGTEADGPLARALAKLAVALGVEPDGSVDVDLGPAEAQLLADLRHAAEAGTEVEIDYYSYGRDELTTRRIAPWRVSAEGGGWYVEAWCHLADGERIFRLDRIAALRPTGELSEHQPDRSDLPPGVFHPRPDDPRVTLRLEPEASWVVETYPCEDVVVADDGSTTATFVVTAIPWLERLLVRLGPQVTVTDQIGLPGADQLGATAAHRILARYHR